MQIIVQVLAKGGTGSLRKAICARVDDTDSPLFLFTTKKMGRNSGWAKLHSKSEQGVLNIEWDGNAQILLARAIARGGARPHGIVGQFISYLFANHPKRVADVIIREL